AVINRSMEYLIRQCPEQYLWGYNRYKGPRAS
ncbi:MAG TPA: lysophospholipid acyltransferase family protein, partial [Burkholderiaceae bacterium]